MSDNEGSDSVAAGTGDIIDNMTPGSAPGSREYDGRDAGDLDSARDGVDLLFASIGAGLCPEGSVLAADRDRLLWNAVEQLRSHVGRLEARLESRLREPTPEQREQRARDNETDGGETDVLLAQEAENTGAQLGILRRTLDHAMHRYGEVVGRPWLARHGTVDTGASEYGLGNQVDSSTWFAARALKDPAPDVMTHIREAMEHADRKRAALRDAGGEEDLLPRLEDLTFPFDAGGREETAAAVSGMFQALELIFPDGTQLQDERKAGAWRTVRLFDAGASRAAEDALRRMSDHPALRPNPEASARFDEETRTSMLRLQQLSRATDAAGAFYCETTGEEEWNRRDPAMTAPGGPRDRSALTGRHHAAARRVAALGHPAPQRLEGPDILIVGSPDMDRDRDRETVELRLSALHRRYPQMVLHYGARLRDRGGVDRNRGIDAIVHRWATGRGVPLVPNPPVWDAANRRFDLHSRDDAWIAMKPDLVVDFNGTGNAHRRFVALAQEAGIRFAGTGAGPLSYEKACVFRNTRGQWGLFNNTARLPNPVLAADRTFVSAEHLFQMARFRDAPEVQARIAGARSPGAAAKIGREAGNERDPVWRTRRVDAMRWAIRMKREANPDLIDAALERTGNRPIVDASSEDPFWGVQGVVGRNTLGRLWMELRQQIRDGDPRASASAWPDPLIPVINLATESAQSAWQRLQQLRPPTVTATKSATEARGSDAEQRRALRQWQLQTRWRGMLDGLTLRHLERPALAGLHRETTAAEERLDSLSRDQLLKALDSIEDQAEQLRAELDAGGPDAAAKHITALDAAGDRIHAVLAGKNLAALREQEGLDTDVATDAQERVMSVMLSAGKLASEGPLAMEPNLLVGAAAGIFLGEAARVGQQLAEEARIRSGLGLTHTPGSEEEARALASRGPGEDPKQAGEAFAHMLTDVEREERDDRYRALAHRSLFLDMMAETAQTFARASRVDMRRQGAAREERLTGHLQGVSSGPDVQRRQGELRAAHRQLIDSIFTNLAALCPVDHVSAAGANSDRDRLLARFASLFREVRHRIVQQVERIPDTDRNADRTARLREAGTYLGELAGYADKAIETHTDRAPLLWTRRATQTAGEWLIERQRRARHREKTEALAPDGRHVVIVGGRDLHGRHAGRIAELLNRERLAHADTPLVLHCIAQDGAGRHAAEWAASHGVTCVTHRPQRYAPAQLRRRDDLLLGIPPDTVWDFGAEGDHERAASMLLGRARTEGGGIEIRDMAAELESPLSSETVIEPREQVTRAYKGIHHAWEEAEARAGDGALVYQEGVEALLPAIDRTLASPHLAGHERRFLSSFKEVIESEIRVRDEISHIIDRARNHLASYEAILKAPHQAGVALNDINPDYRKWDLRAELIVKTIDNWSGTGNAAHREHLDRRRLDLTDLAAELRAIRKAARDPEAEPHRVEVSLKTGVHSWDQIFDRRRFTELTLRTLKPEEERKTVAEFARWTRAWPEETRATFKAIAAARETATLHTRRLAASLPPGLAAGMVHINEEIWAYQGKEIMQRQAEHSMGMSA